MKYLKRHDGIAQVLVVGLVAIVLVAIGLAVLRSQQAKTTKVDKTTSSPTPTAVAQGSPSPAATSTPANEFNVTELGIKMTLPAGLAGLTYVVQTNQSGSFSDGTPYTLSTSRFTTTSLQQLGSQCTTANGPIGTIVRYSADPRNRVVGVAEFKQVGSIYLGFETPQQSCSNSSAAGKLETSQTTLLRQAFDSTSAL
jgi:hypothetical protein